MWLLEPWYIIFVPPCYIQRCSRYFHVLHIFHTNRHPVYSIDFLQIIGISFDLSSRIQLASLLQHRILFGSVILFSTIVWKRPTEWHPTCLQSWPEQRSRWAIICTNTKVAIKSIFYKHHRLKRFKYSLVYLREDVYINIYESLHIVVTQFKVTTTHTNPVKSIFTDTYIQCLHSWHMSLLEARKLNIFLGYHLILSTLLFFCFCKFNHY